MLGTHLLSALLARVPSLKLGGESGGELGGEVDARSEQLLRRKLKRYLPYKEMGP